MKKLLLLLLVLVSLTFGETLYPSLRVTADFWSHVTGEPVPHMEGIPGILVKCVDMYGNEELIRTHGDGWAHCDLPKYNQARFIIYSKSDCGAFSVKYSYDNESTWVVVEDTTDWDDMDQHVHYNDINDVMYSALCAAKSISDFIFGHMPNHGITAYSNQNVPILLYDRLVGENWSGMYDWLYNRVKISRQYTANGGVSYVPGSTIYHRTAHEVAHWHFDVRTGVEILSNPVNEAWADAVRGYVLTTMWPGYYDDQTDITCLSETGNGFYSDDMHNSFLWDLMDNYNQNLRGYPMVDEVYSWFSLGNVWNKVKTYTANFTALRNACLQHAKNDYQSGRISGVTYYRIRHYIIDGGYW